MRKGVDPGRNAAVLVPGERAGKSFWCRDANGNVAFEFRENNPSLLGLSFTPSQNWADIVLGGRVLLPAGQKASVSLSGDVGGWNATSKLDYQFVALLGYKLSPKWTLQAGYRYLFVEYRPGCSSVLNLVTSGALIGATYRIK